MHINDTAITLNIILAGGTIFAWYQFYLTYTGKCDECSGGSCDISVRKNPFKSKCFIGALFFTLAFLLALRVLFLVNSGASGVCPF